MNKKQKIESCIDNLNLRSTAKVCNVSIAYVSRIWSAAGYSWRDNHPNVHRKTKPY